VSTEHPTAVLYLRVSSAGQVNKGFDPEGYSIPSQREACERHAQGLGAEVIAQYVEPGKTGTSTNRPALQKMLTELAELRPTYVIVYDLSRIARNDFDALDLLRKIEQHGCKLESTLERIDDTPAGKLLYTVMAGVNAFRSRGDALKVKAGMQRKHATGGTVGRARIGYINVRKRIAGREVRTVELDPERAPLIRMAFEWYATGDYTISMITEMLEAAGLRSMMTAKRPSVPLTRSSVHALLRDDYYVGVVTFDGVKNPNGEHPKLVDQATFDRVQELLDAHRIGGNRSRKYEHYLCGSLFCECGGRMVYSRVRGNGGQYEYFKCYSKFNRRSDCNSAHIPVDLVEAKVEQHYQVYPWLTPAERERVREAVRHFGAVQVKAALAEAKRAADKLEVLKRQQQQLLHLAYEGLVDTDVLATEQARIKKERADLARWQRAASLDAQELNEALDEALRLIEDPGAAYHHASSETRRLFNQALFERLIVREDDGLTNGDPTPFLRSLEEVARMTQKRPRSHETAPHGPLTTALDRHEARKRQDRPAGGLGLNETSLVPPTGFEPVISCVKGRRPNR
jgi:site-specific DNA recombinase